MRADGGVLRTELFFKSKNLMLKIIILLILAVLTLCFMGVRYIQIRGRYTQSDSEAALEYRENDSMEDMDLSVVAEEVSYEEEISSGEAFSFRLPCRVVYYKKVDGKLRKAFVLPKGTVISINSLTGSRGVDGLGIYSYPTKKIGWRYVRPLLENESGDTGYYVRLSSLRRLARRLVRVSPSLSEACEQEGISRREAVNRLVYCVDRSLFVNGVYFSKDLAFSLIWFGKPLPQ